MTLLHRLIPRGRVFWLGLFLVTWALSTWAGPAAKALGWKWVAKFPRTAELPTDKVISRFMKWLLDNKPFFSAKFSYKGDQLIDSSVRFYE